MSSLFGEVFNLRLFLGFVACRRDVWREKGYEVRELGWKSDLGSKVSWICQAWRERNTRGLLKLTPIVRIVTIFPKLLTLYNGAQSAIKSHRNRGTVPVLAAPKGSMELGTDEKE